MPPRNPTPPAPLVVVRKKRPHTSPATVSRVGVAPTPKPANATPQPAPPAATVLASLPPVPATSSQTGAEPLRSHEHLLQERKEFLAVLRARWPQVFPTDIRLVKPHALGIHREIRQRLPEARSRVLHATLRFYHRWGKGAYWRAITKGGPRYNLDGLPSGEVTEQEKEHARRELEAMAARWRAPRTRRHQEKSKPEASPSPTAAAATPERGAH